VALGYEPVATEVAIDADIAVRVDCDRRTVDTGCIPNNSLLKSKRSSLGLWTFHREFGSSGSGLIQKGRKLQIYLPKLTFARGCHLSRNRTVDPAARL